MSRKPTTELLAKASQEVEQLQRLLRELELARLHKEALEAQGTKAATWTVEERERLATRLPIPDEAALHSDRARLESAKERARALRSAQPRPFVRGQRPSGAARETPNATAACYMSRDGQVYGPYRWDEMQAFARHGQLVETDIVWLSGWPEWVQASRVPELRMPPET